MQNNSQDTMLVTLTVGDLKEIVRSTVNDCLDQKGNNELLTREEIMSKLSCGSTFLNKLTKQIPHYKIGKRVYYSWREVMETFQVFRSE